MALKTNTLDESLKEQNFKQQFNDKKNKKVKKEKNKNKSKGFKRVIALVIAATLSVVAFVSCQNLGKNKNKNKDKDTPKKTTSSMTDNNVINNNDSLQNSNNNISSNKTLADLGIKLEFPKVEKPQIQNPSNDKIDINKVVEDDKGTLWVDNESKENSSNIGKVEIDTKEDSLVVKNDGNVYEKEEDYEIKDKNDNIVSSGKLDEDGIPDGYIYDDNRDEIVKEEEAGKYVYSEYNFYFKDGSLVIAKGDLVSIETYEKAKLELSTTKPEKSEPVEEIVDTDVTIFEDETKQDVTLETEKEDNIQETIEEGVINPDGTYTIYGTTYESKADFEQFLLTPDEYGYYNDMIMSLESIEKLNTQKTLIK